MSTKPIFVATHPRALARHSRGRVSFTTFHLACKWLISVPRFSWLAVIFWIAFTSRSGMLSTSVQREWAVGMRMMRKLARTAALPTAHSRQYSRILKGRAKRFDFLSSHPVLCLGNKAVARFMSPESKCFHFCLGGSHLLGTCHSNRAPHMHQLSTKPIRTIRTTLRTISLTFEDAKYSDWTQTYTE